ncbi:MAG: hypothetical protein ACK4N6_01920, partial [Rhodocyclaceae bacterium]
MALVPLETPALLGLLREALDGSLVERGFAEGLELLGDADVFWQGVETHELQRMARGGNTQAMAELAWRCAVGVGMPQSAPDA